VRPRLLAAGCLIVVVAAACGGDDESVGERRAEQVRRAAADAGLADDVQDFLALAASAPDATYRATYATDGEGAADARQVLVAQQPPQRRIDIVTADGAAERTIVTDDTVHTCTRPADGDWSCSRADAETAPPTVGVFDDAALDELVRALDAALRDYDFVMSERPVAGARARCLVTRLKEGRTPSERLGAVGTLCLSDEGVVLLAAEPGSQLEASSYTTSLPEDTFDLPTDSDGATDSD
jgi:hypothetical protein